MNDRIKEMFDYYKMKIYEIDMHYFFSQDKVKDRIDYKRRSRSDIRKKEIYQDFVADLQRIMQP